MSLVDGGNAFSTYGYSKEPTRHNMLYFGTRERMTWVRAPDANYEGSRVGWEQGTPGFLNGGTYIRRSTAAHRTFNYSWSMMSRDEIRDIMDYAEGVWGSGAIYFLDPFAMDKNLLPQHWATPRTTLEDAPSLSGGDRAGVIEYPLDMPNSNGYPLRGTTYAVDSTWPAAAARPKLYVPIPPGYVAWFGMHGIAASAQSTPLVVTPTSGTPTRIPVLANDTAFRFSHSWSGDVTSGIEISLSASAGSMTVTGMMLQVLPESQVPEQGRFISGQGHSGARFATQPSLTQNNKALDKQSMSVQLIEDEAWR